MKSQSKAALLAIALSISVPVSLLANNKLEVKGEILYYNTDLASNENDQEITESDVDDFREILEANPDINTVYLTGWGGIIESAYEIADLIIDYGLDTNAVGICFSACGTLLLGGEKRTLAKGSKIGFHRSWWDPVDMKEYYESEKETEEWSNPFEFAAWAYEDAQESLYKDFKFLVERGIEPYFAIETVKAHPDQDGWYPRRKELLEAGFLTE